MTWPRPWPTPMTCNKLAFEYAPIGIVLTEDRIIRQCNRQFAEMFGYPREALIGQSFRMLYASNKEFEAIRDVRLQGAERGGRYMDERLMPRRDGSSSGAASASSRLMQKPRWPRKS